MNERESILEGLYAVRDELGMVLHCQQELQNLSSQLDKEKELFHSTTIRAKFKQAFAAFCIALLAVCALESLLRLKFDEAGVLAFWAFLVYQFSNPKRYQDKKLTVFRAILTLLGVWLVWFYVKTLLTAGPRDDISIWYIITSIFYGVAFVIFMIVAYRLLSKKRLAANEKIAENNEAIRANNAKLRARYAETREDLLWHSQEVDRLCKGWFPMDYCSMYAVRCFIRYLENYQADTVKEMVNLFEESEHKRRMEQAQYETQLQIEDMTLTSIRNSWAIQTTMNQNAKDIQDTINRAADRIRWGG